MRNREDNEIVPYVPVERVDEVDVQHEVEEPVEINLNMFGFVRSVLSYRIDPNMYRLSIVPPPTLMTTTYTSIFISHLSTGVHFPLDPRYKGLER